jgi:hypothetical protein
MAHLNLSSIDLARGALKKDSRSAYEKEFTDKCTWGSKDTHYEPDMQGVIALANAIPDMGAMTSLNLSSNCICAEGAKHIAESIKVGKCVVTVVLATIFLYRPTYAPLTELLLFAVIHRI